MRIYKPTWKKNGETKTSPRYHVVFRDHTNTRRRLAAFADKALSEELGRKAEKLVECVAAGQRPTLDLAVWLERTREDIRAKFIAWGLIDDRAASLSKPLTEHADDFHAALLRRETSAVNAS